MSGQGIEELINKKEYGKAKELLQKALKENSQNAQMQKLLGLCNINLGCFDEALENFNFLLEKNSEDALAMYYTANIYYEKNQLDKAENILKNVIRLRSEYIDAYKTLAVIYFKEHKYSDILELEKILSQKNAEDPQIYDISAAAATELSNLPLAIDYLKKAIKLQPDSTNYIMKLGITYFNAGKPEEAINCYKTAYEHLKKAYENKTGNCLETYAFAAYKAELYEKGIELYTKLTKMYPEKESYQYNLACCYDGNNDMTSAANIIERLLTFNLNSLQLKLHLASLYSRMGRVEAAKVLYADVISLGYTDKEILYEYAIVCAQSGDTDKAEELLKEIIKTDPDFAFAYKDLAIIYTNRRLFDQAEEYFEKAQKIGKGDINILFEIANYHHLMADFEKAQKIYSKVLENEDVPSYMLIAVAKNYISLNMLKEAKEILLKLFEDEPSNVDILFYLAQIYTVEKNYDNVKQLLETAYTISPVPEIANMLARAYMETGMYDKAYSLYKVVSRTLPASIPLLLEMADCKCRQKDYATALEHIQPILEVFPEHEEALEILEKIKKGE